ncbi:MAG: SDR family NAD(P)-dependent oxidoreductase [Deltaproteobacteria bacterium]
MARVLVTGSADGLGKSAAAALLDAGHRVVVHVRSDARRSAVHELVARGADVVVGDLAELPAAHDVARQVNALGPMDAVIHNAGVYSGPVMNVNVLAPYVLTARIPRPSRLIYVSSGMHRGGGADVARLSNGRGTYSDSKLFVSALAAAVGRRWPAVRSHSVCPGWVPTRMGGASAPDDLALGHVTQVWLATSEDAAAQTSGYWHHQAREEPHPAVHDPGFQDRLLEALATKTGVALDLDASRG